MNIDERMDTHWKGSNSQTKTMTGWVLYNYTQAQIYIPTIKWSTTDKNTHPTEKITHLMQFANGINAINQLRISIILK